MTKLISSLFVAALLVLVGCSASESEPTATEVPEPTPAGPRTGELAPDFTLPDSSGNMVNLADELQNYGSVVLLFYLEHT